MSTRPLVQFAPEMYGGGLFGEGLFGAGVFGAGEATGAGVDEVSSIAIFRGLSASGVTETPEPGSCVVVLHDEALNPLTYEHTRTGRPMRVVCEVDDDGDISVIPVFTGTIENATVIVEKDGDISIRITALDATRVLAQHPYEIAHGGSLRQRVTPVLESAGVAFVVSDAAADEVDPDPLPTNQNTALGQLILARDTLHGYFFVDRDNVVQVKADRQRSRDEPAVTLTDGAVDGFDYVEINPQFSTEDLVNVLTVELLTDTEPDVTTFTDDASVAEWGPRAQTVTVNGGLVTSHDLQFRARLSGAGLSVTEVVLNATVIDAQPEVAALEIYDAVRVVRDGLVDQDQQIVSIETVITPRRYASAKWMTRLTLRKRELLPLRWMDVPDDIRWSDLDPAMTWDTSIAWHP